MERRFFEIEVREDDDKRLRGYAAVFYDGTPATEYELWDGVYERIDKGAFGKALRAKTPDTVALFNHNPSAILGRRSAGTLKLEVDKRGLVYAVDLAETSIAGDVREHVRRGDLRGSSFAFVARKILWSKEKREGREVEIRLVKEAEVYDVGPVTYPAYAGSTTALRDMEGAREEYKFHLESLEGEKQKHMAKAFRVRMLEIENSL